MSEQNSETRADENIESDSQRRAHERLSGDAPSDTTGSPDSTVSDSNPSDSSAADQAVIEAELERADLADKYDRMMRLANLFDRTGLELRERTALGQQVLAEEAVADSAALSTRTWESAEADVRAAFSGKHGLESHALELDADALIVRATVLTYRWIDELQEAAYRTLGSIAGRAIGYLAPEIELGGLIVSAGLIETDALDRDDVAGYLNDLAETHPDLMDHVSGGGGGLVEALQMRSLLTASTLASDDGPAASRGGLTALGVLPLDVSASAGLRDTVAPALTVTEDDSEAEAVSREVPRHLEDLMTMLTEAVDSVAVHQVGERQYITYLTGPTGRGRLRLVGGDAGAWTRTAIAAIERAVAGDQPARVMLVGCGQGGVAAAEIAATCPSDSFTVDQVVTVGAPGGHVPVIPESTRVISLEDRSDPVALLGSLINERVENRLTVVYDGGAGGETHAFVAGGRAADQAAHEALRIEISRLRDLGYLAG